MVRRAAASPNCFTADGLGAALRRRSRRVVSHLRLRELEVLRSLAAGALVAGMGRELAMSESTVETHLRVAPARPSLDGIPTRVECPQDRPSPIATRTCWAH